MFPEYDSCALTKSEAILALVALAQQEGHVRKSVLNYLFLYHTHSFGSALKKQREFVIEIDSAPMIAQTVER